MDKNLEIRILSGAASNETAKAFYPDILPMEPGDSITWVNEDSKAHSITSGMPEAPEYSGIFFKTGSIDSHKSGSVKITDIKDHFAFYYFCEIHPWLTGKIVVSTAPESQPDTVLPIVLSHATYSKGQDIKVTGKVADDYAKIKYDLLVYDKAKMVDAIEGKFNGDATLSETVHTGKLASSEYTLKLVYGLPTQIASTSFVLKDAPEIPDWVKTSAESWSRGAVSDGEFIQTIQYLSEQKIISPETQNGKSKAIPYWVKTTASWWANEQISDAEFVGALEYLVNARVIQI